jgi:iron complex outermembrane receptor protein
MSELMNARNCNRDFRRRLLATVSAFALLATIYGPNEADATDQEADRPTVWIELGGQLEHIDGQGEPFAPAFLGANPNSVVFHPVTPLQAQNPPPFGFGEEGKISFQPEGSDWIFSASLRYGRSSSSKSTDHQTYKVLVTKYHSGVPYPGNTLAKHRFADTKVSRQESDAVLDFSAGQDVGLGMFGKDALSTVNFGVRFAQFTSKTTADIRALPTMHFKYAPVPTYHVSFRLPYFHTYHATGQASRSFRGIGPSLSWSGSAPVIGDLQDGEIALDWGANAALLFGKQKADVRHQESAHYHSRYGELHGGTYSLAYHNPPGGRDTLRSVVVPNAGGFAGASWRLENFKASFGYRADFFFGAIDGGIDTRKEEAIGFYGPFATISVGLGG